MRRFSQRNSLVTLSDIITTPLLEQGMPLQLPKGLGTPDLKFQKRDLRTVEVSSQGTYMLERRLMRLEQIARQLAADYRANPNLIVYFRVDKNARFELAAEILDRCEKVGITHVVFGSEPLPP